MFSGDLSTRHLVICPLVCLNIYICSVNRHHYMVLGSNTQNKIGGRVSLFGFSSRDLYGYGFYQPGGNLLSSLCSPSPMLACFCLLLFSCRIQPLESMVGIGPGWNEKVILQPLPADDAIGIVLVCLVIMSKSIMEAPGPGPAGASGDGIARILERNICHSWCR